MKEINEETACCAELYSHPHFSCAGVHLGNDKRLDVVLNEGGFIEIQILMTYMIAALTMFAFILGLAFGVWKQASAKYMWFGEAMEFATQAANTDGSLEEVKLNENKARKYFNAAMSKMGCDYSLNSFSAVSTRTAVPGGEAQSPGYIATITVPIYEGNVPLIGQQDIKIPMRYFAIARSSQLSK